MKIETQLNKRRFAIEGVKSLYSTARHVGLTHAEMLKSFDKIFEGIAKCPSSIQAYVIGYRDALTDQLYRADLIHGGMIDGVFYSTHSDREDYYAKHGFEPNVYADDGLVKDRGHYWKESLKPFFISK